MGDPSIPTRRTAAEDYPHLAAYSSGRKADRVDSAVDGLTALAEIDRLRAAVSSEPEVDG